MTLNVTPMHATGDEEEVPPSITCDALWTLEDKGERPAIIDIRDRDEWETGHIDWATHLPLHKVEAEVEQIFPNKTDLIIACCSIGGRSEEAVKKMQEMGYTNVHNLSGGYSGYCAKENGNGNGNEEE